DPFASLTLIGLVAFRDPPRPGVAEAIEDCRRAGVRVVMLTGDHPATALGIAREIGLIDDASRRVVVGTEIDDVRRREGDEALLSVPIFARVDPAQKLELIALHQRAGAVVAMTGDGVNDAPALRKADVGVAMGRRGTEVARQASDLVLLDDAFESIVEAIRGGRVIFDNIRRFVFYLLSCNLSEVLLVCVAAAIGVDQPILPLQILFLNLVTDVFPALALAFGDGDPRVLLAPPRPPGESILTRRHWIALAGYGGLLATSVLFAFVEVTSLGASPSEAITVAFLTLGFGQVFHVIDLRRSGTRFWRSDLFSNRWLWGAVTLCAGLLIAATHLEPLAIVLDLDSVGASSWGIVTAHSIAPSFLVTVVRGLERRRARGGGR
ncbi:MAG: cation-transporting P-type ATPase, partial [Planctomycetes bacterium]|nr:cation-transporting P-type ATPase [Planctomycetota bacterium]